LSRPTYDLCVVGAGVAGALVAAVAARRGQRVVIVEAGPRFDLADRKEQIMRHQVLGGPIWRWHRADRDAFVDASMDDLGYEYDLNRSRVRAVGGSTLHWGGMINRLWESDFRTASTWGLGIDWPLSYADIEPWYCLAEIELGVAGTPNPGDPPRSQPYPMPGFPPRYGEAEWLKAADRLGIRLEFEAHARNSRVYAGRPPCMGFAVCSGCPIGARYSADFHVEEAEETGLATVLTETAARRIEVNGAGQATAIYATSLDGTELVIAARNYVIAAHAIETARLLLLSDVGGQSDQVGRNLMEHWYVSAQGVTEMRSAYPGQIGFATMGTSHWYDGPGREGRGAIKIELNTGGDPLRQGIREGLVGRELREYDCERFARVQRVDAETEHQPNPDSRVTLDPDVKDLFGDPVPRIRWALSETDRRTRELALEHIQRMLDARGCSEIEVTGRLERAHHHMGTCRMSVDPGEGVVDTDCRVHGVGNLFISGTSVFPTGGARQPTLTAAALALRLADYVTKG
jgi:choline dehydrogenase-like flavoprotein